MGQSQSQSAPTTSSSPESKTKVGKSGKKICCACPDTKKARDECIRDKGEDDTTCQKLIELHKECLRADGFTVK